MKQQFIIIFLVFLNMNLLSQSVLLKKNVKDGEMTVLKDMLKSMQFEDQEFRDLISNQTLDRDLSRKIDSVFNTQGIKEGFEYRKKMIKDKLAKPTLDSLWNLQAENDLQNHIKLRGLIETFGYLPKEMVGDLSAVQFIILLHPPREWDVKNYHQEYGASLLEEVKMSRMPAKKYALFYDNMLAKILKRPQLYGTGSHFDPVSGNKLPALIEDITETNKARAELGLKALKTGEYRIIKK